MRSGFDKEYEASTDELRGYWAAYGGWRSIVRSPVVWLAIIFTMVCAPLWIDGRWADLTISTIPSLLGFSLGAMAIILAFPSSPLFRLFTENGRRDSYYLDLSSKFAHFIIIQVIAILIAFVGKAYSNFLVSMFGFFMLSYAVGSAALAALALFGVAQIHNHPGAQGMIEPEKGDPPSV